MIIVEGVDNAGKSLLVRELGKKLKWTTVKNHRIATTPEKFVGIISELAVVSETLHGKVIFDRHPIISEMVYGPAIRQLSLIQPSVALAYLARTGSKILFCCPPISSIRSGFHLRPQMSGVEYHLEDLAAEYAELMWALGKDGIPILYFDYTEDPHYDALFSELEKINVR